MGPNPLRAAALLLVLAAAGCGQKGALYLPDRTPTRVPPEPAAEASPAASPAAASASPAAPAEAPR